MQTELRHEFGIPSEGINQIQEQFHTYIALAPTETLARFHYFHSDEFKRLEKAWRVTLTPESDKAYSMTKQMLLEPQYVLIVENLQEQSAAAEYLLSAYALRTIDLMKEILSPEWKSAVNTLSPDTFGQDLEKLDFAGQVKLREAELTKMLKIQTAFVAYMSKRTIHPDVQRFSKWALWENFARGLARLIQQPLKKDTVTSMSPEPEAVSQDSAHARQEVFSIFTLPPAEAMQAIISDSWQSAAWTLLASLSEEERDAVLERSLQRQNVV